MAFGYILLIQRRPSLVPWSAVPIGDQDATLAYVRGLRTLSADDWRLVTRDYLTPADAGRARVIGWQRPENEMTVGGIMPPIEAASFVYYYNGGPNNA